MARTFQNVSPLGDLNIFGKVVAFGETVEAHAEADADSLASQPLHWLEVIKADIKGTKSKAAPTDDKADSAGSESAATK